MRELKIEGTNVYEKNEEKNQISCPMCNLPKQCQTNCAWANIHDNVLKCKDHIIGQFAEPNLLGRSRTI